MVSPSQYQLPLSIEYIHWWEVLNILLVLPDGFFVQFVTVGIGFKVGLDLVNSYSHFLPP